MTVPVLAGAAGIGLVALGFAWLLGVPTAGLVGAVLFLTASLRLASDMMSRGVGQ